MNLNNQKMKIQKIKFSISQKKQNQFVILFIKQLVKIIVKLDLVAIMIKAAKSQFILKTIEIKKNMLLGTLKRKPEEDDENLKQ